MGEGGGGILGEGISSCPSASRGALDRNNNYDKFPIFPMHPDT